METLVGLLQEGFYPTKLRQVAGVFAFRTGKAYVCDGNQYCVLRFPLHPLGFPPMVSLSTESKPSYGIRRAVDQTAILHNDPSESSGPGRGDGSGIGSPGRGGLGSRGGAGLGSPDRGGLGSPERSGLGSPDHDELGSPDRGGLDSPGRGGLGSPNRGGLGSRGDTGPGR